MCRKITVLSGALAILAAACGDSTGPDADEEVAVRFALSSNVAATGTQPLIVTGTNGTLRIEQVWMIVDELELNGSDDSCPSADDDECEFETGPFLLKLPLSGTAVTLASDELPAGTYSELEFEVEDVEFDDDGDDADERASLAALWTRIRSEAADWPQGASLLIAGTFTPTGGTPQQFRTFFDAEIELEVDLVPPLVKTADNGASVTVQLDPALWLRRADGTVLNLAAWNYATTGRLLEFELEIEQGFNHARVELDD